MRHKVHSNNQGLIYTHELLFQLLQQTLGNGWIRSHSLEASVKPKQILGLEMFLGRDGRNKAVVIPARKSKKRMIGEGNFLKFKRSYGFFR